MFRFIKEMFSEATVFIESNLNVYPFNAIPLKCDSMSNQECKVRPAKMNIDRNEPLPYPCNILVVVIILMVHMLNYEFLMLLKI